MDVRARPQKHVFLSYIREDSREVDLLEAALTGVGLLVWRDKEKLWPGDDWELKIREAIQSGSLAFIACFSENYAKRDKSYQNEELILAAEEYRKMPPGGTPWLFTVRFSECDIPSFNLGAGRSLGSTIQRTDLFADDDHVQLLRLVQRVTEVAGSPGPISPVVAGALAEVQSAESPARASVDRLKILLRDPNADIALEDEIVALGKSLRDQLLDEDRFSTTSPSTEPETYARSWIARAKDYEAVVAPALEQVKTCAMFGLRQHEPVWTAFMQQLTSTTSVWQGNTALIQLRQYPVLILIYVAALASTSRANYGSFRAFVADPTVRLISGNRSPFLADSGVRNVADDQGWIASALAVSEDGQELTSELLDGLRKGTIGGRYTPLSDHIFQLVSPLFSDRYPDPEDLADAFDRAEALMDAVAIDQVKALGEQHFGYRGGFGRYTWRHRHNDSPPEVVLLNELTAAGSGWTPLLGGLFGGDFNRARVAVEELVDLAPRFRNRF